MVETTLATVAASAAGTVVAIAVGTVMANAAEIVNFYESIFLYRATIYMLTVLILCMPTMLGGGGGGPF